MSAVQPGGLVLLSLRYLRYLVAIWSLSGRYLVAILSLSPKSHNSTCTQRKEANESALESSFRAVKWFGYWLGPLR